MTSHIALARLLAWPYPSCNATERQWIKKVDATSASTFLIFSISYRLSKYAVTSAVFASLKAAHR